MPDYLTFKCTFIRSNGKTYTKKFAQSSSINLISDGEFSKPSYAKLYEIDIPAGITSIGINAFRKCSQLKKVILHDGIFKIHAGAFKDCTSLDELTIPGTVDEIGDGAFKGCENLKLVIVHSRCIYIHETAFEKGVCIKYV